MNHENLKEDLIVSGSVAFLVALFLVTIFLLAGQL